MCDEKNSSVANKKGDVSRKATSSRSAQDEVVRPSEPGS